MNRQQIEKPKLSAEPPKPLLPAIADARTRYGSASQFMLTFNKDIQPKTALNLERAYLGTAPSLNTVRQAYTSEVLTVWIMAQLEDVNDFAGIREKMGLKQMESTAHIIATEYGFLKVTELHLFLHRLKAGRYGVFYGYVDPLKITQALIQFADQRRNEISAIERKREQIKLNKQREEWSLTAVTRHEYEQLKNK